MYDDLLNYAESREFGELHIKVDVETGLRAIIAIHNTKLGPALGGCRCLEYPSTDAAIFDAMRLARAMSYKAALVGLPQGGGKAVLMKPKQIKDRQAYFRALGRFINSLNGQYITAVDSGTDPHDMDSVCLETPYVTSLSTTSGETSLYTAAGVRFGIQACVKAHLKTDSLTGLHVAIQGVGNVGYYLAKELHQLGAKLTVCDTNEVITARCADEFQATVVGVEEIYDVPCDIFSPCALGAVINDDTLTRLNTKIIAGCANNQLAEQRHGEVLFQKGILFAPDYVINAGGLIYAASIYNQVDDTIINDKIAGIYDSLLRIFDRMDAQQLPANEIAEQMALEILQA